MVFVSNHKHTFIFFLARQKQFKKKFFSIRAFENKVSFYYSRFNRRNGGGGGGRPSIGSVDCHSFKGVSRQDYDGTSLYHLSF